jgi:hypothetical protein
MIMNKPFFKTGIVGLLVLVMSVVLLAVFPSKAPRMPDGFFTPIIAFEFIETNAEVFQMFVSTDATIRQEIVNAMDLGNRLDYIYMCLYSLFLLLFSVTCAKISGKKFYYIGAAISTLVLAGDIFENIQLLGITAQLENGNFDALLTRLHIFTWVKWGGMALIFVILFFWFKKGNLFSKIIGAVGLLSFHLGMISYLLRSVITEIFCLSVALMFILMIIYCFNYKSYETA